MANLIVTQNDYAVINDTLTGLMGRAELEGRAADTASLNYLSFILRTSKVEGGEQLEPFNGPGHAIRLEATAAGRGK